MIFVMKIGQKNFFFFPEVPKKKFWEGGLKVGR